LGCIDDPIWQALCAMRIEPDGASLTFTKRLARENGWSRPYAAAVVEEYKRFLYLAATGTAPVTPSEQVDQAWHLHLAYTRHYWGELCARIIGRPLHHGPTAGGGAEGRKYRALYSDTLARYRDTFGSEPSADIWPPVELRFARNSYQWVDRSRNFVLPRRAVSIAGMAGSAALLAACTALAADTAAANGSSVLDSFFDHVLRSDLSFFGLIIVGFITMVTIGTIIDRVRGKNRRRSANKRNAKKRRDDKDSGGCSDYEPDGWSGIGGSGGAAAGGAAFIAGGGDFGGSGADGGWDSGGDSGSDSGGDSGCSSSGCGGGCGGGD
jgi:hypothetical protein